MLAHGNGRLYAHYEARVVLERIVATVVVRWVFIAIHRGIAPKVPWRLLGHPVTKVIPAKLWKGGGGKC